MIVRKTTMAILALVCLTMLGCSPESPRTAAPQVSPSHSVPPPGLQTPVTKAAEPGGYEGWVLQYGSDSRGEITGFDTDPHGQQTLRYVTLERGRFVANESCNGMGGTMRGGVTDSGPVSLTVQYTTAALCNSSPYADAGRRYSDALGAITSQQRDGSTLVLTGPQTRLEFVRAPVTPSESWVLKRGSDAAGTFGKTTRSQTIYFYPDDRVTGIAGCNRFGVGMTATGANLVSFSKLDSTLAECRSASDERVGQRYVAALLASTFYRIDENTLVFSGPGVELRFERRD